MADFVHIFGPQYVSLTFLQYSDEELLAVAIHGCSKICILNKTRWVAVIRYDCHDSWTQRSNDKQANHRVTVFYQNDL